MTITTTRDYTGIFHHISSPWTPTASPVGSPKLSDLRIPRGRSKDRRRARPSARANASAGAGAKWHQRHQRHQRCSCGGPEGSESWGYHWYHQEKLLCPRKVVYITMKNAVVWGILSSWLSLSPAKPWSFEEWQMNSDWCSMLCRR